MRKSLCKIMVLVLMLTLVFAVVPTMGVAATKTITVGIQYADLLASESMTKSPSNLFPHDGIKKVIANWEKKHPGYKIQVVDLTKVITSSDVTQMGQQYTAMLKGGTEPDVVAGDLGWVKASEFWQDGSIVDLTPYFNKPTPYSKGVKWVSTLALPQHKAGPTQSQYFYTSLTQYQVGWLYNADIFAKYGWKVPKTQDAMIALFKKIVAAGFDGAFICVSMPNNDHWMHNIWGQTLGSVIGKQMQMYPVADPASGSALNTEEQVRAVKKGILKWAPGSPLAETARIVKEMADYFPKDWMGMDGKTLHDLFMNGKVPMLLSGTWEIPGILTDPNIKFTTKNMAYPVITNKTTPLAGSKGLVNVPWSGMGDSVFITKKAKDDGVFPQALDFVQFLNDTTSEALICNPIISPPAVKGVKTIAAYKGLIGVQHYYITYPDPPLTPEYTKFYYDEWSKYAAGRQTLNELITKMQAELQTEADHAIDINKKSIDQKDVWDQSKW